MGRQQVQPALRQAGQQQSANPKLQQQQQQSAQPMQQQQQSKQQFHPTTASMPVANKAVSRPQSASASQAQAQVKQQPKQQQAQSHQLRSSNAQVYRPTPVKEHPDDAFLSGAWMFDQSRVPQWMSSQLPTQQQSAACKSTQQQLQQQPKQMKPQQQQPVSRYAFPSSINQTIQQQVSKNIANAQVCRPSPVKEHVDDAFSSGAWLFDESRVPQWMAPHLPKVQQQMQQRSATPKSAQTRPTPVPTQQQAAKPAVQQKQQQPVMQQRQQPTQQRQQQQQKQLPTMQHGDVTFLWNGWSQASRQPLWTNNRSSSTTSSMKPATMNAAARPQSSPGKQSPQQQSQGQKRRQPPAHR